MSSIEKEKHFLHTYQRVKGNKETYRCVDPYCPHYIRREYLEGKAALCNKCGAEFILDRQQLRNKVTVCINCSKSPKKPSIETTEEIVESLFEELNLEGIDEPENED